MTTVQRSFGCDAEDWGKVCMVTSHTQDGGRNAQVVIVGAGLAGVRAAEALRTAGFDGRVLLVGGERHLPYDRPPLSKELLRGSQTPTDIQLHAADFYARNQVDLRLGTEVTRLLPAERGVVLATGETLHPAQVLLCTGGHARRLDIPGSTLPGVHYLRSLDDALLLRDSLTRGGSVVVVGAGFIGLEVAAAARELGCPVTVLEAAPIPLSQVLSEDIGWVLTQLHRERGVDLHTCTGIARINGTDRVREVVTTDGQAVPADVVVVGVGMIPATRLAEQAGIKVDNGILVDEYGRTSHDAIFAAGDTANRPDARTGRRVRLEHWQSAQRHAAATAVSMLGQRKPFNEVPWFWSDQYGINLQLAGDPLTADEVVIRGVVDDLCFAAFSLRRGRVSGVVGVNRPPDVRAAMTLIEREIPVERSALSDHSVDLRQLARRRQPA